MFWRQQAEFEWQPERGGIAPILGRLTMACAAIATGFMLARQTLSPRSPDLQRQEVIAEAPPVEATAGSAPSEIRVIQRPEDLATHKEIPTFSAVAPPALLDTEATPARPATRVGTAPAPSGEVKAQRPGETITAREAPAREATQPRLQRKGAPAKAGRAPYQAVKQKQLAKVTPKAGARQARMPTYRVVSATRATRVVR